MRQNFVMQQNWQFYLPLGNSVARLPATFCNKVQKCTISVDKMQVQIDSRAFRA